MRRKSGGVLTRVAQKVEQGRQVLRGALVGDQVEAFPSLGENGGEVAPETFT
jgi:hypothetical protein